MTNENLNFAVANFLEPLDKVKISNYEGSAWKVIPKLGEFEFFTECIPYDFVKNYSTFLESDQFIGLSRIRDDNDPRGFFYEAEFCGNKEHSVEKCCVDNLGRFEDVNPGFAVVQAWTIANGII